MGMKWFNTNSSATIKMEKEIIENALYCFAEKADLCNIYSLLYVIVNIILGDRQYFKSISNPATDRIIILFFAGIGKGILKSDGKTGIVKNNQTEKREDNAD